MMINLNLAINSEDGKTNDDKYQQKYEQVYQ